MLIPAGKTVSASFDVSAGYDMSEAGTYTLAVDTYIEYVESNKKQGKGKPPIPKRARHLSSLPLCCTLREVHLEKLLEKRHVP